MPAAPEITASEKKQPSIGRAPHPENKGDLLGPSDPQVPGIPEQLASKKIIAKATSLPASVKATEPTEDTLELAQSFIPESPWARRSTWEAMHDMWRCEGAGIKRREDGSHFVKATFRNVESAELLTVSEDDPAFTDFVALKI